MSEQPATEARGGERPDWERVRPGEVLPEREDPPGPDGTAGQEE